MSGTDDVTRYRRDYRRPYGGKKNIPTVQEYRREKQNLHSQYGQVEDDDHSALGGRDTQSYVDWARAYWYGDEAHQRQTSNNDDNINRSKTNDTAKEPREPADSNNDQSNDDAEGKAEMKDTTEVEQTDLKTRRKQTSQRKAARAEREVTDPITHLPVKIHDFTDAELDKIQEDYEEDVGTVQRLLKRLKQRTDSDMSKQMEEQQHGHDVLKQVFPPPDYDLLKEDLQSIYSRAVATGVAGIGAVIGMTALMWYAVRGLFSPDDNIVVTILVKYGLCIGWPLLLSALVYYGVVQWAGKQAQEVIEDDVWENADNLSSQNVKREIPESTLWLNRVVGSIWPLVNPDLFESLADTLEDVMQASLPSLIRMVHIEDLGQGSEAVRILGIRWLPKGAAGKSVIAKGDHIDSKNRNQDEGVDEQEKARKEATETSRNGDQKKSDSKDQAEKDSKQDSTPGSEDSRKDSAGRQHGEDTEKGEDGDRDPEGVVEGMEAEEGDFVNLEIAFAYKTAGRRKTFRDRAKHAHLMLAFYLFGGIKVPVWVELRGLVGSMRVRMQLTPDPPFVALTTVSFLGQPNVDVSCTPLTKRGLNIMDVPLISNFVQGAVDAAVSSYVAPKSITLDLKAMLAGDDFKRDTAARGVVVVKIKRAFDFKAGDAGIPLIRDSSSDAYVTVAWAKFGKPLFSTRVIVKDMEPYWQEEAFCLVGPEEIDAGELLRLQLWDSDRLTVDDDLGRIEVPLKDLMQDDSTNGKMLDRVDAFKALKAGEGMPGRCEWSVGYFSKTRLLPYEMEEQELFPKIHDKDELRAFIDKKAQSKLREASRNEKTEIEQLKEEDFEDAQARIISSTRPPEQFPSGILSVQIHQIVGLAREDPDRSREDEGGEQQGEEEDADSLPNAYTTIIINGKKVYKTRVKPKNSKPFFNAGCERFIRDWRTTEVFVSVRDARLHENDPLLGLVYLPLAEMFRKGGTSHFNAFFPIVGGIGYGRARISVVFRAVQMQPPPTELGWEYGCVRVEPSIVATEALSSELQRCKLVLRTPIAKRKMHTSSHIEGKDDDEGHGIWTTRHRRPIHLPVRKRYAVALVIEFKSTTRQLLGGHKTRGFSLLWLQDIPDDEKQEITLPVYKGDMYRAATNALPHEKRGEQVGSIKLNVTFVRGLSKWHRPLAKGDMDVANVFELLTVATDNGIIDGIPGEGICHKRDYRINPNEQREEEKNADDDSSDDSEDSDSDAGEDDTANERERDDEGVHEHPSTFTDGDSETRLREHEDSGRSGLGGLVDKAKAYKHDKDVLHRRQRGVMQWKPARTAAWLKSQTGSIGHRLSSSLELKGKEPGIEKEV